MAGSWLVHASVPQGLFMPRSTTQTEPNQRPFEWVATTSLCLDAKNPRLAELSFGAHPTQDTLLRALWENMAVDELALSISASRYFSHEPLFVTEEEGELVVLEGNRRLAAVLLLLDPQLRRRLRATDLPTISPSRAEELSRLPVIRTTRREIWQYLGFKHVNGAAKWDSYAKAQYIVEVHDNFGVQLEQIAQQIGDKNRTVQRLYRAMMVIQQAERAGVFHRENRYKSHFSFSHLYTSLDYEGFKRFLRLSDATAESINPVPDDRLRELGELCRWLYGDKQKEIRPVVESQNPDLGMLDPTFRIRVRELYFYSS
jgi:hypothetical protein